MKSRIKSNQAISDEIDVALDDVVYANVNANVPLTSDIEVVGEVDIQLVNELYYKVEAGIFYAVDIAVRWGVYMRPPEPNPPNLDKFLKDVERWR
jgi:hypothetical protein